MDAKDLMAELSDKISKTANSRAVFGEPLQSGENMIIPVARVAVRGGGGGGSGDANMKGDGSGERGKGTGMGLGLNIASTPVGYINVTPSGAEFVPIVDKGRILLGLMSVLGLALWVGKAGFMMAGRKQSKT